MLRDNNKILNAGLDMAMEFGNNWLKPINERLQKKFPDLNEDEINFFSVTCNNCMEKGHHFVYEKLSKLYDLNLIIADSELKNQFKDFILNLSPWINKYNIRALYSQAMYYAWKEGLDKIVK